MKTRKTNSLSDQASALPTDAATSVNSLSDQASALPTDAATPDASAATPDNRQGSFNRRKFLSAAGAAGVATVGAVAPDMAEAATKMPAVVTLPNFPVSVSKRRYQFEIVCNTTQAVEVSFNAFFVASPPYFKQYIGAGVYKFPATTNKHREIHFGYLDTLPWQQWEKPAAVQFQGELQSLLYMIVKIGNVQTNVGAVFDAISKVTKTVYTGTDNSGNPTEETEWLVAASGTASSSNFAVAIRFWRLEEKFTPISTLGTIISSPLKRFFSSTTSHAGTSLLYPDPTHPTDRDIKAKGYEVAVHQVSGAKDIILFPSHRHFNATTTHSHELAPTGYDLMKASADADYKAYSIHMMHKMRRHMDRFAKQHMTEMTASGSQSYDLVTASAHNEFHNLVLGTTRAANFTNYRKAASDHLADGNLGNFAQGAFLQNAYDTILKTLAEEQEQKLKNNLSNLRALYSEDELRNNIRSNQFVGLTGTVFAQMRVAGQKVVLIADIPFEFNAGVMLTFTVLRGSAAWSPAPIGQTNGWKKYQRYNVKNHASQGWKWSITGFFWPFGFTKIFGMDQEIEVTLSFTHKDGFTRLDSVTFEIVFDYEYRNKLLDWVMRPVFDFIISKTMKPLAKAANAGAAAYVMAGTVANAANAGALFQAGAGSVTQSMFGVDSADKIASAAQEMFWNMTKDYTSNIIEGTPIRLSWVNNNSGVYPITAENRKWVKNGGLKPDLYSPAVINYSGVKGTWEASWGGTNKASLSFRMFGAGEFLIGCGRKEFATEVYGIPPLIDTTAD